MGRAKSSTSSRGLSVGVTSTSFVARCWAADASPKPAAPMTAAGTAISSDVPASMRAPFL